MEGQLKTLAANKPQVCGSVCACVLFASAFIGAHKLPSVYLSLSVAYKALLALCVHVGVCLLQWRGPTASHEQ